MSTIFQLKRLKDTYERLADIYDNVPLDEEFRTSLNICINTLAYLYFDVRQELPDEKCRVNIDGEYYYFGKTIEIDYYNNNEVFGAGDIDYCWWK